MKSKKLPVIILIIFCCLGIQNTVVAQDSSKVEMYIFEGSDWCVNCKRFDKEILKSNVFQQYITDQKIVITNVDFPQKKSLDKLTKKRNEALANKFQFEGIYPSIYLKKMDGSKQLIPYTNQNPTEFIKNLNNILQK